MTRAILMLVAGLLAGTARADDAASPPLAELARDAEAIVLGRVERTEFHDLLGVRLHRVRALRVLGGHLRDPDPDVLELRDGATEPPKLAPGRRVIVFLRDGPPLSHYDDGLPRIPCFAIVGGADGVIAVQSDADVEAVEAALRAAGTAAGAMPSTVLPVAVQSP